MVLNVGSKPPRGFTAGGKYSVAWELFHYLTPQEWHTGATEKAESCTNVSGIGNIFLGCGRVNVGEFNLFCCYLSAPLSYSLRGQDPSKNGDDLCLFYFVQTKTCPWQSYNFLPLLFVIWWPCLCQGFLQLIPSHDISVALLPAAFPRVLISNL